MKRNPLQLALLMLLAASLACTFVTGQDVLPPTATPEPTLPPQEPTPTPVGDIIEEDDGFFVLNLSTSDQEGLALRADEIYQEILNGGGDVDRGVILEAYAHLVDLPRVGGEWQPVGPAPIRGVYLPQGRVPGSGRVNGFAIDPRNSNVVYAAASIGGIWKTEDGGRTWRSLVDQQVPLIYGGIVMHPDNPDTLYALLGELDGQVSYSYGFLANGILRSEDAGETWDLIGADVFNGAAVTALVFDDDRNMYAASGQMSVYYGPPNQPEFGIFRSSDGGTTWDRLASCSDFGNCFPSSGGQNRSYLGGFFDLVIATDGTLFASHCVINCFSTSILRSRNGGQSWEKLDLSRALRQWEQYNEVNVLYLDNANTVPALDGFEIAVSATDPNILIAGGGISWYTNQGQEGIWSWVIRSTDGGDTWEFLPGAGDYCSGQNSSPQCTYDNIVEIDPTNPNIMYIGGSLSLDENYNWVEVMQRSEDGGDTWYDMTPAREGSLMHPDAHGMAFDPNDPNILWVGTDGGIYRTQDASAFPPRWENLSEGLNTLLFIDVALHPTDPNYLIGGLQDNAKTFTNDRGTWIGASSGDGAYVAVDPFRPTTVYGTIYPPTIFERNTNGGEGNYMAWNPSGFSNGYNAGLDPNENWLFYPPFTVDPNNAGVLYIVSNRVYRTSNRADSWEPISGYLNSTDRGSIQSIAVAPSDSNVIYVGLTEGTARATFDGGQQWYDITGDSFPPRNITRIVVHPQDSETAYLVFSGFNVQTPNAPGHVFMTTDGGATWNDVSYDLPDAPLTSVVVDIRDGYAGLYVGGALGVWVLQEGSREWLPYGTGMPFALVSSLQLNPNTGVMAAGTYGRSVWVMDMP